jgi:hypothetical protein
MGDVYSRALRCLVWLGEVDDAPAPLEDAGIPSLDTSVNVRVLIALSLVYATTEPRWWERAWVTQEVALAQSVLVCFGALSVPWDAFCELLKDWGSSARFRTLRRRSAKWRSAFTTSLSNIVIQESMADSFSQLDMVRTFSQRSAETTPRWSFAIMLPHLRSVGCSDYRDKVYSMLSLVDPREAARVVPRYNIPWVEVYARATFASISVQQNCDIWRLKEENTYFEPTWAIDFSRAEGPEHDDYKVQSSVTKSVAFIGPNNWTGWMGGEGWIGGREPAMQVTLSENAALLTVTGYFWTR